MRIYNKINEYWYKFFLAGTFCAVSTISYANFNCELSISNEWTSGGTASISIHNNGFEAATWATILTEFPEGITVSSSWGATSVVAGNQLHQFSAENWNASVAADAVATVGFQYSNVSGADITTAQLSGDCKNTENRPPVALFTTGLSGYTIMLDAGSSSDPDGDTLTYTWYLDGELIIGPSTSPTGRPTVSKGTHDITLVVSDGELTDELTLTRTQIYPYNPTAKFRVATNGLTVELDASESSSRLSQTINKINAYEWDFGDGNTGTGKLTSHTYDAAGDYSITLTVVDDEGSGSTTRDISISSGPNTPPTLNIQCETKMLFADYFEFKTGYTTYQMMCGAGAEDAEGDSLTYTWDAGDGSAAYTPLYGGFVHAYVESGTHTITLTVSDGVNTVTESIDVETVGNGHPPEGELNCVADGLVVTCKATATDADGNVPTLLYTIGGGAYGAIYTGAGEIEYSEHFKEAGEVRIVVYVLDSNYGVQLSQRLTLDESAPATSCEYAVAGSWGEQFQGSITITNNSDEVVNGWDVTWEYTDGSTITNVWNANLSGTNPYNAASLDWNASIQPGESVSFGFNGANGGDTASVPVLSGAICGK